MICLPSDESLIRYFEHKKELTQSITEKAIAIHWQGTIVRDIYTKLLDLTATTAGIFLEEWSAAILMSDKILFKLVSVNELDNDDACQIKLYIIF